MTAHEQPQTTLEDDIDVFIKQAQQFIQTKGRPKVLKEYLDSLIKKSTQLKEKIQNIDNLEKQEKQLRVKLGTTEPHHVFDYQEEYPDGSLYHQAKKLVFHLGDHYKNQLNGKKVAEWEMPESFFINISLPTDPLCERFYLLRDNFLMKITQLLIGEKLHTENKIKWCNINSEYLKFNPATEYPEDSVYGIIQRAYQHLGIPLTNESQGNDNNSWPDVTYHPDISYQDGLYFAIQSTHRRLVGDWQREVACSQVPNYEAFKENDQSGGLYGEQRKYEQKIDELKQKKTSLIKILGSGDDFNIDQKYSENSLYDRTRGMINLLGIKKEFSDYLFDSDNESDSISTHEIAFNLQDFWEKILGDGWTDEVVEFHDEQGLIPAIKALHSQEQTLRNLFVTCKSELERTTDLMGLNHLNEDIDAYIKGEGQNAPDFSYDQHHKNMKVSENTLYGAMKQCLQRFLGSVDGVSYSYENFQEDHKKHNELLDKPSQQKILDQDQGLFKLYQDKTKELDNVLSSLDFSEEKTQRDEREKTFIELAFFMLVVGLIILWYLFDKMISIGGTGNTWEGIAMYILHKLPFALLIFVVVRTFQKLIQGAINQYVQHGHESAAYASIVTLSKNVVEAEPWFREAMKSDHQEEKGESLDYSQKYSRVRDTMLYHYLKERAQSTGIPQDSDLKSQKEVASIKDMAGVLAEVRKIFALIKKD